MGRNNALLNICIKDNTWEPPVIDEYTLAMTVRNDSNAMQCRAYFCVFQVEPYIDSIYVEYTDDRNPKLIRRYAFHESYSWDEESEEFFMEHCIHTEYCSYSGGMMNEIFRVYSKKHPEWHLQRYYAKSLRMLDHIYNCIKENTVKEILYKAGLDELAVYSDGIEELNLLSRKPSDIYDGLSIRILRAVNCPEGAVLLQSERNRNFLSELNFKFPDTFKNKLNDAQCRYLGRLIKGSLVVGEVGRLFRSRRAELSHIWNRSQFEIFMAMEGQNWELKERLEKIGSIDPIYRKYVNNIKFPPTDDQDNTIRQLTYYLLKNREEYDKMIRRSNRKREYDWQERGDKYVVRYPQTINDFCRESVYMMNCLMAYLEALIKNDTTILFMRRLDDVNTPFITIEIEDNTLMQAYHRFNMDCSDEEADWIIDYCKKHGIKAGRFAFNAEVDELF